MREETTSELDKYDMQQMHTTRETTPSGSIRFDSIEKRERGAARNKSGDRGSSPPNINALKRCFNKNRLIRKKKEVFSLKAGYLHPEALYSCERPFENRRAQRTLRYEFEKQFTCRLRCWA